MKRLSSKPMKVGTMLPPIHWCNRWWKLSKTERYFTFYQSARPQKVCSCKKKSYARTIGWSLLQLGTSMEFINTWQTLELKYHTIKSTQKNYWLHCNHEQESTKITHSGKNNYTQNESTNNISCCIKITVWSKYYIHVFIRNHLLHLC